MPAMPLKTIRNSLTMESLSTVVADGDCVRTSDVRKGTMSVTRPHSSPPSSMHRPYSWLWIILAVLMYVTLSIASTYPLIVACRTSLPMGTELYPTVPLFNLWTLWWNVDRAQHGFANYWQAPIYFPASGTFAFSEPQPWMAVLTPLVWAAGTPVLAYNISLLLHLTLNGLFTAWLIRGLISSRVVALCGGAMVVMLPFVHWQLGVYQLIPLWSLIWAIHALVRYGKTPSVYGGVQLGAALACSYWLCANYTLFLVILLFLSGGWLLGDKLWRWRTWLPVVPGVMLCIALVIPIIASQITIARAHGLKRQAHDTLIVSAEPGDYSIAAWDQLLPLGDFASADRRTFWHMSPGNVKLLLAALGVVIGLFDPSLRRWTLFIVTLALTAFCLSQGLKFGIGPVRPYQFLYHIIPGMDQVRSTFRFAVFVHLAVTFLAAQGLLVIWICSWFLMRMFSGARRVRPLACADAGVILHCMPGPRLVVIATSILLLFAGLLAAGEIRPSRQHLHRLPSFDFNAGWIGWLQANTLSSDVIAHIPFPQDLNPGTMVETTTWMYWQTFHGRRMVNGYSGFAPSTQRDVIRYLLERSKPEDMSYVWAARRGLDHLKAIGVRYCVIRRGAWTNDFIARTGRLTLVYSDRDAGQDIYTLMPVPHPFHDGAMRNAP